MKKYIGSEREKLIKAEAKKDILEILKIAARNGLNVEENYELYKKIK